MKLANLNHQILAPWQSQFSPGQFLQSDSWANFQKKLGRAVWTVAVVNQTEEILASAQIIEQRLGWGKSYLYCPRGPLVKKDLPEVQQVEALKLILTKAREITISTKQQEEIFLRFEPSLELPFLSTVCRRVKAIQPKKTWLIDLQPNLTTLSAQLHPKTRYNINLAKKKKVIVRPATLHEWPEVWRLLKTMASKQRIRLHAEKYYQTMLTCPEIVVYLATLGDKYLACALTAWYADTVTYLHGGSDYTLRQLMGPQLLHWEIITQAKEKGFSWYDFHGIAETDDPADPWAGITRFKKSFGGQVYEFPGTFDFIYQPTAYQLYNFVRQLNLSLKKIFPC